MTKKKKTRREKEISRLKRELQVTTNSSGQYTFNPKISTSAIKPSPSYTPSTFTSRNYTYVMSDVKKTLSVTSVLFIGNLILYFLITRNILHIVK